MINVTTREQLEASSEQAITRKGYYEAVAIAATLNAITAQYGHQPTVEDVGRDGHRRFHEAALLVREIARDCEAECDPALRINGDTVTVWRAAR